MHKTNSSYAKAALLLCLLGLQQCTLPTLFELGGSQTASLPAASYFRWVMQADTREIGYETQRLQAPSLQDPLIAQIQRAVLRYRSEEYLDSLPHIEVDDERMADCNANSLCSDYLAFEPLLRELLMLKRQLANSEAAGRVLEDRIRNLDQQIEALTNIEQQLLERDQRSNQ